MNDFYRNCRKMLDEQVDKLHIAVIGDIMLDQYFSGEVTRISPEAPVPVNHVRTMRSVLGGASNVASNLLNLGCRVSLGSISGDDRNRVYLDELLEKEHMDASGVIKSTHRPTTTKTRVLGMGQQMLRLDFEETDPLFPDEMESLQQWFTERLQEGLDGVLLSDYAKGVCSPEFCRWVIDKAKEYHIPVLVDPKGKDWGKYVGCTVITPNVKELSDIAGCSVYNQDEDVVIAAQAVRKQYPVENIAVTRSEQGITLVGDNTVIHSPAVQSEVFDVTGCGDTVAAVLLVSVVCGLGFADALELANRAAGVVITRIGTYPIHRSELLQVISDEV